MKKMLALGLFLFVRAVQAQSPPVPPGFSVVQSAVGDLDKDGVKELVVAYNTQVPANYGYGVRRELIIYKKVNQQWKKWVSSSQALMDSELFMGNDPLYLLTTEKGVLSITQGNDASREKWTMSDTYRFQQGDFYLIGYDYYVGSPCERWEKSSFNLSTGKLLVNTEYETCNREDELLSIRKTHEKMALKGVKITLRNRNAQKIRLITPKYHTEIPISPMF